MLKRKPFILPRLFDQNDPTWGKCILNIWLWCRNDKNGQDQGKAWPLQTMFCHGCLISKRILNNCGGFGHQTRCKRPGSHCVPSNEAQLCLLLEAASLFLICNLACRQMEILSSHLLDIKDTLTEQCQVTSKHDCLFTRECHSDYLACETEPMVNVQVTKHPLYVFL